MEKRDLVLLVRTAILAEVTAGQALLQMLKNVEDEEPSIDFLTWLYAHIGNCTFSELLHDETNRRDYSK